MSTAATSAAAPFSAPRAGRVPSAPTANAAASHGTPTCASESPWGFRTPPTLGRVGGVGAAGHDRLLVLRDVRLRCLSLHRAAELALDRLPVLRRHGMRIAVEPRVHAVAD